MLDLNWIWEGEWVLFPSAACPGRFQIWPECVTVVYLLFEKLSYLVLSGLSLFTGVIFFCRGSCSQRPQPMERTHMGDEALGRLRNNGTPIIIWEIAWSQMSGDQRQQRKLWSCLMIDSCERVLGDAHTLGECWSRVWRLHASVRFCGCLYQLCVSPREVSAYGKVLEWLKHMSTVWRPFFLDRLLCGSYCLYPKERYVGQVSIPGIKSFWDWDCVCLPGMKCGTVPWVETVLRVGTT